jgi:death on curing protein
VSDDADFLTVEDVVLLHEEQLARYGGGAGVRDSGALDSAIAMPRATFNGQFVHEDLFAMAAAYAPSLGGGSSWGGRLANRSA